MAITSVSVTGGGTNRKPTLMENIAMGVDIAAKVLGTGVDAYKVFGLEAPKLRAEKAETEAKTGLYKAQAEAEKTKVPAFSEMDKLYLDTYSKDNLPTSESDKTAGKFMISLPDSKRSVWLKPKSQDTKDVRSEEDSLRKEFLGLDVTKSFTGMHGAAQSAQAVLAKPEKDITYADDMALVYSFITAQDPKSRVTGGEIQVSTEASPVVKQLAQKYNEAFKNQKFIFDPQTRKDFAKTLFSQYDKMRPEYLAQYDLYKGIAERRGARFDVKPFDQVVLPDWVNNSNPLQGPPSQERGPWEKY